MDKRFLPITDPRNELSAQRLDLDTQKLSLAQMRVLTEKTQLAFAAVVARYKITKELDETLSSAIAVKRLGDLDPTSKDYEKERAAILFEHSNAFNNPVVRQTVETQDILHRQHAAAQENFENQKAVAAFSAPLNQAKTAEQLSVALKNLDMIASQFGKPNPKTGEVTPIPPELQNFKTYVTQLGAALTKPTEPTATPTPAPTTTPQPSPTPAGVSTENALQFLHTALGQTSPAPTAAPAQSPVAAVSSGEPDNADAELSADE
jgi:hypothetical protein